MNTKITFYASPQSERYKKREKDAVQLHSARNKTKLTTLAAAQCAGQKQGKTDRKMR